MIPHLSARASYIRRPDVDRRRIRGGQQRMTRRRVAPWLDSLEERCLLSYMVTDLGTLGGGSGGFSSAYGMNDAGQVVGTAQIGGPGSAEHAFVGDSSHGIQDLGSLGGPDSSALAINDVGQAVGESDTTSGASDAFVWDSSHGMQDLGSLGGTGSIATAINDSGQVVGSAGTVAGPTHDHAFLWDSSHGMQDLGTLGGADSNADMINSSDKVAGWAQTASGATDVFVWDSTYGMQDLGNLGEGNSALYPGVFPEAINDSGQVVGYAVTASGALDAFVADSSHGIQDLGTLGGNTSAAYGINDSGQVVGIARTASGAYHAFLWDSINGMQDLGSLGGNYSVANAINNSGQVVGYVQTNSGNHAFEWDSSHGMQDLSTLVGAESEARFINSSGQVSGDAYPFGGSNYHAFLWSPRANSPVFSALSSPTINYGRAATTLSGHIADGSLIPPAGETVSVTLNGVTQNAVLDGSGNFSTSFSTGGLPEGTASVDYFYAGDSSFGTTRGSGTVTVQPPTILTITVNNQTKVYGAPMPTLTASYSGFVDGDTAASLTTPPSLNTTATPSSQVGSYSITASGASDPGYVITYVAGALTITQDSTTTTVTSSLSSLTPAQPVTFTATVSASAPGAGAPTGTVDFVDSTTNTDLGSVSLAGGSASLTVTSLPEAPADLQQHNIIAIYGGDSDFVASDSSATPLPIVVVDVPPTVGITNMLPTDSTNTPTAPVGTLLPFGVTLNDSPAECAFSWSVALNGQPYSLPASTVTNGTSFSFTPTAVGTYVVSLNVNDPDGGTASAQQTVDVTSMDANSLQNVLQAEAYYEGEGTSYESDNYNYNLSSVAVTVQDDPTQLNAAVTALNNIGQPVLYDCCLTPYWIPVSVTLNLTSGNYQDVNLNLQPGVSVTINGVNGSTTIVGNSPALTVAGGDVTVNNVAFTTATDAPTILVSGGSLALRNDVVQSSTGFPDAAIAVTGGGSVDLGSATSPGDNTINVNGNGQLILNTTSTPVSTAGNTLESNGTVLPGSNFSATSLSASAASVIPGQPITFTATVGVPAGGSGTPTGKVDFVDATNGVDLGTAALVGGVAQLSAPLSAVGTHVIVANYLGDGTFLPSTASVTESVIQSIYLLDATASGALTASGNAAITIPGNLIDDSSAKAALSESGNAAITAASVQVVGGVSQSGKATLSPAATTLATAAADPLASLRGPSTANLTSYGSVSFSKGSNTLYPGIYSQISASGNASLLLKPGMYIIEGGGFTVTGNASVSGAGVTIYNTGSSYPSAGGNYGGITLSGNGTFKLSAAATAAGGAYPGILIYQSRSNTRAVSLSGNGSTGLSGTIYAPSAQLSVSGNAQLNAAVVVDRVTASGNVTLTQMAAGSDGAGDASGIANSLLAGNLNVFINDPAGLFTADELARIQDSVNTWDALLAPYSVTISLVTDPTLANMVIDTSTSSACGGMTSGVLGCFNAPNAEITMIQGWDWYAGSDPAQIGAGQYDFETTMLHELGHALGLGGSTNPTSPMYEVLAASVTNRTVTTADLNIPDPPEGADPQKAAGFAVASVAANSSLGTAIVAPGSATALGPAALVPSMKGQESSVGGRSAAAGIQSIPSAGPALSLVVHATGPQQASPPSLREAQVELVVDSALWEMVSDTERWRGEETDGTGGDANRPADGEVDGATGTETARPVQVDPNSLARPVEVGVTRPVTICDSVLDDLAAVAIGLRGHVAVPPDQSRVQEAPRESLGGLAKLAATLIVAGSWGHRGRIRGFTSRPAGRPRHRKDPDWFSTVYSHNLL